jgi:2'-5' RNA ligase
VSTCASIDAVTGTVAAADELADVPDITGIIVPVPEAQAYAPHPHITLLAPFRARAELDHPDLHDALRNFFAERAPFHFKLVQVRQFPNAQAYLAPEPDEPFRAMTIALTEQYPDTPPYGGQFPDVIPHLTIDARSNPYPLPIAAHATAAQLVHSHADAWDVVATFGFHG